MKKKSFSPYCNTLIKKFSRQKSSQNWTKQMIQKIIYLQDYDGEQYLNKNSIDQLLIKIDKNHIEIIDKFSHFRQNGFNLLQFVRFFLNILQHQQIQNLYLTIGLIDLFKAVSTYAGLQKVSFSHITNFFCQKILEKQQSKNQIQAKNIPQITYIKPNYKLKDFTRNPPTIYGSNDDTLYKLSQNSIMTDKSKHVRAVNSSQFSYDLKMIFTLDALSQYIAVYDFNCSQINKIYPSFSKIKKDVVVLSFSFSQRQFRLGAALKNFSIVFWDCSHNNTFDYQKSWSTTSYCQHLQSSIYHLDYFNAWITSDKTGTLYFWDLLNSRPSRQFKCKFYSSVNIICEIAALNILAVVQQSKQMTPDQHSQMLGSSRNFNHQKKNSFYECNIILYNYFNGQILNQISCQDDRVPHTIQYSQQYQILFSAGLQKKIKLWQINPVYMDSSLKGQLIGHQNLITSFTRIKKTSLLVSCDDKGKIKLWDFKNFACIQTIDFSDKAMITNLLDMVEIGKIGVLGSRIHYIDFQDKVQIVKKIKSKQKLNIEWIDHDQCRNQIYLFTQKDLRVLDMNKGSVKYIYGCFNSHDQDYTCFRYFSCISKFAIGNDKGQTMIYDISTGGYLYKLKQSHQGSVIGVEYDQNNKLFITLGSDSSIFIHKQCSKQLIREIKGNCMGKQISCFQLSVYHNLIAISTHEKQFSTSIFLWNYQYGKLSGEILIKQGYQINAIRFINGYNILVIGTTQGSISLVRIKQLTGSQIKLQQLRCIQFQRAIMSIQCETLLKGGSKPQLQQCMLIISFDDNTFRELDLTSIIKGYQTIQHCKQKTNYNPYRQSKQTFSMQYLKKKHQKLHLKSINKNIDQQNNKSSKILKLSTFRSVKRLQTQVKIDVEDSIKSKDSILQQSPVKIKLSEGEDCANRFQSKINLPINHLSKKSFKQLANHSQKQLYEKAQAQTRKKTIVSTTKAILQSTSTLQKQKFGQIIQTGFNQVNMIKVMNYEKRFIIVVGNSRRLKIYNQEYKLICDLNVNYPLPYLWNFKPKSQKKVKDKIYFAIKVLNSILNKYQTDISVGQAKNYKLKALFDKLNLPHNYLKSTCNQNSKSDMLSSNILMLTQPNLGQKNSQHKKQALDEKIPLIQEQFTKNDLNFQLVKEYNFHQVAGPTLKQLDHIKKIQLLQKQWRQKQLQQHQDCDKILKMIQTKVRKNEEKQQLASFLSPSNRGKQSKQNNYVSNIRKKIQNLKLSSQKDQQLKERQKGSSLFNASKLMNFSHSMMMTNKKQSHEEKNKQDQHLLQVCLKRHTKSNNTLKRLKTAESFQQYYQSQRPRTLFLKARLNTTQEKNEFQNSTSKDKTAYRLKTQNKALDSFPFNYVNTKKNKDEPNQIKLIKKPYTTGSKFRYILTEMNQKVRQKKLQKVKFV